MRRATHRPEIDVAVEEAYALAQLGRVTDAVSLLEALQPSARRHGPTTLALARCLLLVRDDENGARRGHELLQSLAADPGPVQWQAQLSLARWLQGAGRTSEAATVVKRGLAALRARGASAADSLSKLLALEVRHLQSQGSHQEPEGDSTELLALIDLGRRLGAQTDPDGVIRAVLHEAVRLTGAERGFVVLAAPGREGDESFEFAAAENLDRSAIEEPSFEVSRSMIRQVARTGKIELLRLADLSETHAASHSLGMLGVRAVACVPLCSGHGTLGVLYLDARGRDFSLRRDRRRWLELLAAQAAVAVENARAHRDATITLQRAEETIRRHHSMRERRVSYHEIFGASHPMQAVYRRLDQIVPTTEPVIIEGETGTGKELAARLIHERGPRKDREFVAVNCAGLAESLLEGELFGHERGAFTGADRARAGLLEVAHRGTLFLDEIADMPSRMQGDLLRALQSGELRRIGGRETLRVDVRVIAASNRELEREVERGRFRADLYYRLNVLKLELPPLRDRIDDIPLLIERMMPGLVGGRVVPEFSERAIARMATHSWPGNVRELRNILRRVAVQGLQRVDERDLPAELRGATPVQRAGTLQQAEYRAIRRAMHETGGNKSRAARLLGVDRKTLYAKLSRLAPG